MAASTTNVNGGVVVLLVLIALVIFALGEYHVVSGAPGLLVKRVSFGFSDTFASVDDCVGPRLFVFIRAPRSVHGART